MYLIDYRLLTPQVECECSMPCRSSCLAAVVARRRSDSDALFRCLVLSDEGRFGLGIESPLELSISLTAVTSRHPSRTIRSKA